MWDKGVPRKQPFLWVLCHIHGIVHGQRIPLFNETEVSWPHTKSHHCGKVKVSTSHSFKESHGGLGAGVWEVRKTGTRKTPNPSNQTGSVGNVTEIWLKREKTKKTGEVDSSWFNPCFLPSPSSFLQFSTWMVIVPPKRWKTISCHKTIDSSHLGPSYRLTCRSRPTVHSTSISACFCLYRFGLSIPVWFLYS